MTRYKIVLSISHFASVRFKLQPFLNFTLLRSVDSQLFTLETNNESRRLFRIKSRIGYSRILRGCKRWWHELYTYSTVYFHLLLQTFECLRSPPDTISNITSSKSSLMTHQLNECRESLHVTWGTSLTVKSGIKRIHHVIYSNEILLKPVFNIIIKIKWSLMWRHVTKISEITKCTTIRIQ